MADPNLCGEVFFLDAFAQRQWDDPNYSGTRVSYDKAEFTRKIHVYHAAGAELVDGYAPFCKHVFVPNFIGADLGALEITEENQSLLRSGYSRRKPEELPVLTRWFPESLVQMKRAKMLDIILYSREQLVLERAAMADKRDGGEEPDLPSAPWGIISVKAQDEDCENPMQPITMMRNALGREEGGSGVSLDRQKYEDSVAYWDSHAPIVAGEKPSGD